MFLWSDINAQHYKAHQDKLHTQSTGGLLILMHDIITLSDMMSYDKKVIVIHIHVTSYGI